MKTFHLFLLFVLLLNGCDRTSKQSSDTAGQPIKNKYARGFEITCHNGYKLLELHDPQNEQGAVARFALVQRGTSPTLPEGYTPVEVPVEKVVCMTSLQLSNFIAIDRMDAVAGITSTRHLHNAAMQERLRSGATRRIGIEGNFDNEVIIGMEPDIILISPFKRGGYDALTEVGVPLIPHYGYKETTPLGQAEWIRCIGLLLGCEERADSLFRAVADRYNRLKASAAKVSRRPVVFSGELRGGNWYAVGGQSFLAQLFRDAGADYFLKDDPRSGGVTLDFEEVYASAAEVDYWRILNSYDGTFTYDALRDEDIRYADFKAWRDKGVIYCNLREAPFYEQTPVEPDVVLKDLIHIFHPDLAPDHKPVYYRLLK